MRVAPRIVAILASLVVAGLLSGTASALPPADIEQSWARESIKRLMESGIVEAPDALGFKPDAPMTRGEFARAAAKAFGLEGGPVRVFVDAQNHSAREALGLMVNHGALFAGEDTTVRPDDAITREEAAHAIVTLLGLQDFRQRVARWDAPAFEDVDLDNPFFGSIQAAARLSLFPPFMRGNLWPAEPVTRAEAAYMLDSALRLEKFSGRLERVDGERQILWLSGANQGQRSFPAGGLEVFGPDGKVGWADLDAGRELHLVVNRFGRPLAAWAGPATRAEGWRESLRDLAAALLTPEQLRAVLNGDWEQAGSGLKAALYQELVARGVRPWEADALLNQDWNAAQELGIVRLTELLGQYLGVSPELVHAVIDRDWAAARDQAQVEVLERLLQARLFDTPQA